MYSQDNQVISYYNEISMMMFGFGDSHKPDPDTVRLVESITLSQLRLIIQEASKYRVGDTLEGENLIFLMRKNKYKMRRFIKYLQNKEMKKRAHPSIEEEESTKDSPWSRLIQFIEHIDETGELTDLTEYDEVKNERMVRADRISLALDEENYMKFFNARCTSFMSRKMSQIRNFEKLRAWVDPKKQAKFSKSAMEVLSYFAYETVAQITDYALLVRLDHNRKTDPLRNLQGTHFSSAMFNGEHRFCGPNPDYSRVYSGTQPISVNEIKEVMRRVYMPQAGKLNFGKIVTKTHHILAL